MFRKNLELKFNFPQVDNTELELTLWDTAGQEAYEVIRPLAYKDAGKKIHSKISTSLKNKVLNPRMSYLVAFQGGRKPGNLRAAVIKGIMY